MGVRTSSPRLGAAERTLTPEEDAIGDPNGDDDDIDDTLPGDLWFRADRPGGRRSALPFTVYSPVR